MLHEATKIQKPRLLRAFVFSMTLIVLDTFEKLKYLHIVGYGAVPT